jgi:hypothetical protein
MGIYWFISDNKTFHMDCFFKGEQYVCGLRIFFECFGRLKFYFIRSDKQKIQSSRPSTQQLEE